MKKLLLSIISLSMIMACVACSNDSDEKDDIEEDVKDIILNELDDFSIRSSVEEARETAVKDCAATIYRHCQIAATKLEAMGETITADSVKAKADESLTNLEGTYTLTLNEDGSVASVTYTEEDLSYTYPEADYAEE